MPLTTPANRYLLRALSSEPNRSELSIAIGRAPIVNTSRRIPPTPVAAPWYGSIADGWLWDSILNAIATPSPIATTPAFSPGPCMTAAPSVGSVRSVLRECLYEQCSFHSALTTPSSVNVGVRPNMLQMRSNSDSVSPCSCTSAGVISGSPGRVRTSLMSGWYSIEQRVKHAEAVGRTEHRIYGSLRVRHHAENIARCVDDSRDSVHRAVDVGLVIDVTARGTIPECDAPFPFQSRNYIRISRVAAVSVCHRHRQHLALVVFMREHARIVFHAHRDEA